MINVKIKKVEDQIQQVMIMGHANYDEPGKDIVCSAVSALTIGAVNSVEKLLNIDLSPEQNEKKGGYLAWDVPKIDDTYKNDQLQLLMNAMVESIIMIEKEYNKFIKVSIEAS